MKQFMVICAVLPILLIIIVQMSLDQINSYKLSAINRAVFSVADESRKLGYYDYDSLEVKLSEIGFNKQEDIEFGSNTDPKPRGELFFYYVKLTIRKPMVGIMVSDKDNYYYYVIDSCAASELP